MRPGECGLANKKTPGLCQKIVPCSFCQSTDNAKFNVLFVQDRLRKSKSIIFYASYLSLGRVYPFSIRKKYKHVNYFSMFYTHHKTPCLSQSV